MWLCKTSAEHSAEYCVAAAANLYVFFLRLRQLRNRWCSKSCVVCKVPVEFKFIKTTILSKQETNSVLWSIFFLLNLFIFKYPEYESILGKVLLIVWRANPFASVLQIASFHFNNSQIWTICSGRTGIKLNKYELIEISQFKLSCAVSVSAACKNLVQILGQRHWQCVNVHSTPERHEYTCLSLLLALKCSFESCVVVRLVWC